MMIRTTILAGIAALLVVYAGTADAATTSHRSWWSTVRPANARVLATAGAVPAATGTQDGVAVSGTLELRAELNMKSVQDVACPPGVPQTTECQPRTGQGIVVGLGSVTETYRYDT